MAALGLAEVVVDPESPEGFLWGAADEVMYVTRDRPGDSGLQGETEWDLY